MLGLKILTLVRGKVLSLLLFSAHALHLCLLVYAVCWYAACCFYVHALQLGLPVCAVCCYA